MAIFQRFVASRRKLPALAGFLLSPVLLAGCSQTTGSIAPAGISIASLTDNITPSFGFAHVRTTYRYTARDRECMERVMFFESNRSSREGMVAVGTVVMNRLRSGKHGDTICAVVGEPRQFAPGVMTRKMNSKAMPDVQEAANAVLKGERAPKLKNAMHFHTAGLKFPYKNMHYIEVAGGNAFYEKRGRNWQPLPDEGSFAVASAAPDTGVPGVTAPVATAPGAAPGATAPVAIADARPALPEISKAPEIRVASVTSVPTFRTNSASVNSAASGKAGRVPQADAVIAMQEPDAARFGSIPDFDTAKKPERVMTAAAEDDSQPRMAFQSTPDDTNAIGALIMSQGASMGEY